MYDSANACWKYAADISKGILKASKRVKRNILFSRLHARSEFEGNKNGITLPAAVTE
jgi:hypothetical protein